MLGKLAWLKVATENRRTIFKLIKEAVFGRKDRPARVAEGEELPGSEVQGEARA
jgi:hypothetical protein